MRSHLKVYFNFEEDTNALNDTEKGRLLLAMLRYAKSGTESNLTGNERFLFPVFKAQIDRDIETYEIKVNNGSKGGRPKTEQEKEEPNETENNLKKPNETENNLNRKIEDRRKKIEDKDIKREITLTGDSEKRRFTPPTVDEVRTYCQERGNKVNPERFIDFYASKGWKVGSQPMKDWKACVRTWEQRDDSRVVQIQKANPAQYANQRKAQDEQTDESVISDLMQKYGGIL